MPGEKTRIEFEADALFSMPIVIPFECATSATHAVTKSNWKDPTAFRNAHAHLGARIEPARVPGDVHPVDETNTHADARGDQRTVVGVGRVIGRLPDRTGARRAEGRIAFCDGKRRCRSQLGSRPLKWPSRKAWRHDTSRQGDEQRERRLAQSAPRNREE